MNNRCVDVLENNRGDEETKPVPKTAFLMKDLLDLLLSIFFIGY